MGMTCAAFADSPVIQRWEVMPTSLVAQGTPPCQNVNLDIDCTEAVVACTLKVWTDSTLLAEKALGALRAGTNSVSVLLPEPSKTLESRWALLSGAQTLAERKLTWQPPRHWTIYEVLSSHVDIGLHNPQYMQRLMGNKYLDDAQKLVDQTATHTDASRFRYGVEGMWWWDNYERDRSEAAARHLIETYAKPGLIGISASHSGNRTEAYSTEELCRSAYYARELRYRWELAADTMLMVDNNGITWPLVTAYADAGIKYMGFYPNPWNPDAVNCWSPGGTPGSRVDVSWESKLPHLFYWLGPDGKRKILVWTNLSYGNLSSFSFGHRFSDPKIMAPIMAKQLALAESRYPYDVWMLPNYNDNQSPGLGAANRAKAWNAVWRWPELRTVGDLSVPFKDVEARFGDQIPTLSGLMTAGWAQHPVSTPALLADKIAADRLLPTAEKLATLARLADPTYVYPVNALRRAWDALVCNDEHGYGTSYYKGRPVYDTWMQKRAWIAQATETASAESERALQVLASKVETAGPSVMVFNPTLHDRREIVEVDLPASCATLLSVRYPDGTLAPTVLNGRNLRFRTSTIPSFGYALFRLETGTAPLVAIHPSAEPPVLDNTFYRVTFDKDGAIKSIYDKKLRRELVDTKALYRCNQLVYSKDRNKTFVTPKQARFTIETSALEQTVIATLDDPSTQAEIVQRVTLPSDEKRIDIDNRLNHARDLGNKKRWDRFGYYAFPFDVPSSEFRIGLNGCHANVYTDQTGLTTDSYSAARDWAYVGNNVFGVTLAQLDSQLIECGKIHTPKRTFGEKPETSHLYSYVFNDWLYAHAWTTGPSSINLRFRYSIHSGAGPFEQAGVPQFAEQTTTPPLAVIIAQSQLGPLPSGPLSFLRVGAENVELLTLKLSETPGRGVIARLHETEGKKAETFSLRSEWKETFNLTVCSLLEQDETTLDNPSVSIDPFGFLTLRVEGSNQLPVAPVVEVSKTTDAMIGLTWESVSDAKQYHVYRGQDDDFTADEYHLLTVTCDTGYLDNLLSPDTTHYYRVAAVNADARQGALSAAVKAVTTTTGNSAPAKVGAFYTGLIDAPHAWRGDTSDMLYLQWGQNQESDLSHYELYRGDHADFALCKERFLSKVSPGPYVTVQYEDKGLKTHTAYYYRVVAVDRDGNKGEPSDVCEGITREPTAKK